MTRLAHSTGRGPAADYMPLDVARLLAAYLRQAGPAAGFAAATPVNLGGPMHGVEVRPAFPVPGVSGRWTYTAGISPTTGWWLYARPPSAADPPRATVILGSLREDQALPALRHAILTAPTAPLLDHAPHGVDRAGIPRPAPRAARRRVSGADRTSEVQRRQPMTPRTRPLGR